MSEVFIRLVALDRDPDSQQRQGAFGAGYDLKSAGALSEESLVEFNALMEWFDENLPGPPEDVDQRAIFWFRASAKEASKRIWELNALLKENDIHISLIKTTKPGYILYEDEFQVGAIPFKETM